MEGIFCSSMTCSRQLPSNALPGITRLPREAVTYIARIKAVSDDRPLRVEAKGDSALAGACARARNIKRGDGAVRVPNEAMQDAGSNPRKCPLSASGFGSRGLSPYKNESIRRAVF
jgi:hypothetical protein